jgi:hypothetical protein
MALMHLFSNTSTYFTFFINIKPLSCIYLYCFTVKERREGGGRNDHAMNKQILWERYRNEDRKR